jgi:hypothetical protein
MVTFVDIESQDTTRVLLVEDNPADQRVLNIEKQNAEPFGLLSGHADSEIIHQRLAAAEHHPVHDLIARQPLGGIGDRFQHYRGCLADTFDGSQGFSIGAQHGGVGTEVIDQPLGNGLVSRRGMA